MKVQNIVRQITGSVAWFFKTPGGQIAGLLVVIACLMLTAIHPAMFDALPDTPDGTLHLYRLVALDSAIQQGDLWPRYIPILHFGYGAPIFNYYAPLSLYPMEGLHLLGFDFLDAFLIGMSLYAVLGTIGAYLIGKSLGGPVAGIVAAVAFASAPFTFYDWPRRGAVAEFAALMILPWLLWAFWRLAVKGRRRDFVVAVLLFALFIPIHNISTLLGTPLLMAFCLYLWWVSPDPPRALVRMLSAGFIAVGLTTFFWLPALGETSYVRLDRLSGTVSALDFHNNFDPLKEIFSLPVTADLTQIHPPVPRSLGWPQIILAIVGLGLLAWTRFYEYHHEDDHPPILRREDWIPVALLLFIGLLFLMLRISTWLWEIIPLFSYIQFPWRLLGPASLWLALLTGMGAVLVAKRIPWQAAQIAWLLACLLAIMAYALPWLYGIYLPDLSAGTIVDVQNFERETGWLATTSVNEYIPPWTEEMPDMDRLTGLYAQSDVIPRLQPTEVVTVESAAWKSMGANLSFTAESDTTLIFDWIYFPGFWAQLDGEPVTIMPSTTQGLISIDVPEGEHQLEIGFGPTTLRLIAMIVSGVFALGLIVGLILVKKLWGDGQSGQPAIQDSLMYPVMIGAAGIGLALFAGKALLIDNLETPVKRARFANGLEAGMQTTVQANFNHEITLLGYDLPRDTVRSGGQVPLDLYWQLAGDMVEESYSSIVYLRDLEGNIVRQTGSQHPGNWPTRDWVPGFYIQEQLTLAIPPGTPPGTYSIQVALYSHEAKRNLDVFDVGNNPLGVTVNIGSLLVTDPISPARLAKLEIESPLDQRLNEDLTLLGVNPLPEEMTVGYPFALITYWRAGSRIDQVYLSRLVWLDADGEVAAASPDFAPVVNYPTDRWKRRDLWRGLGVFHVPGRLEAGDYQVALQLVDEAGDTLGDPVVIGQMAVDTPARTFTLPDVEVEAEAAWENGITLVGYNLNDRLIRPGESLHLSLFWQPEDELTDSLTVFVHLIDEANQIVAQHDQIPVSGGRPTTGWAPGEIIEDPYALLVKPEVPPGDYRIRIGWYDATTGERHYLADGSDAWIMPEMIFVR